MKNVSLDSLNELLVDNTVVEEKSQHVQKNMVKEEAKRSHRSETSLIFIDAISIKYPDQAVYY